MDNIIEYEEDGLKFIICKDKHISALSDTKELKGDIIIPKSIYIINQEFPVTGILDKAFINKRHIQSIKFAEGTHIRYLYKTSFVRCSIQKFYLPPSVQQIKEGEFKACSLIMEIVLPPNSQYFQYADEKHQLIATKSKYLKKFQKEDDDFKEFRKSNRLFRSKKPPKDYGNYNNNDDDFDVLLFANRLIENVFIPSKIKIIESESFLGCRKIKTFEFEDITKIKTIFPYAFVHSSLESFTVPPNIITIKSKTFAFCKSLHEICFTDDSNLTTIEKKAFKYSSLYKITFPPKLKYVDDCWCHDALNLNEIEISEKNNFYSYLKGYEKKVILKKSDSNSDIYDVLFWAFHDITQIVIPSFIKKIGSFSFYQRKNLQKIEFEENSNLKIIESNAFNDSSLNSISIPSCIENICDYAFGSCINLKFVDIKNCFKLKQINSHAFYNCAFKYLTVPKNVTKIGVHSFSNTNSLYCFEFLGDEMSFGSLCFCLCSNISIISLPNSKIIKYWYDSFLNVSDKFTLFTYPNAYLTIKQKKY